VFEFKTTCFAGFMPQLDCCANCGGIKEIEYFDINEGMVVCKNCHDVYHGDLVKITPTAHKLLRFIENADYKSVFAFNGTVNDVRIIGHICEVYMINSMEIFPASLTYLKTTVFDNK
jgi:DNA repair protein RecO (recombination protein O)